MTKKSRATIAIARTSRNVPAFRPLATGETAGSDSSTPSRAFRAARPQPSPRSSDRDQNGPKITLQGPQP